MAAAIMTWVYTFNGGYVKSSVNGKFSLVYLDGAKEGSRPVQVIKRAKLNMEELNAVAQRWSKPRQHYVGYSQMVLAK